MSAKDFQNGVVWAMEVLKEQLDTKRELYNSAQPDHDPSFALVMNGLRHILLSIGSEFEYTVLKKLAARATGKDAVKRASPALTSAPLDITEMVECRYHVNNEDDGRHRRTAIRWYQLRTGVTQSEALAIVDIYIATLKSCSSGVATNKE